MITISDDNTPFALTYMTYDPHSYNAQLESKVQHALSLLADESIPVLSIPHEIFESPAKNYRHRCRFGVNVDEEGVWYAMWEHGEANVRLISFPLASIYISTCMPILLDYLKHDDVLRNHIKAVNFLSTTTGDLSITLIYEGSFSADWTNHAQVLFDSLRLHNSILNPETNLVGIIGRGKGVKSVVGDENVRECFQLNSGRILQYTQVPDGFSNPNPEVNRKCLNWLCDVISTIPALSKGNTGCSNCAGCIGDTGATCCEEVEHLGLLELYCGNGNHTVALAGFARYVVSVEINKSLCVAAEKNLAANELKNVCIVPCDSGQFAERILRKKCYLADRGRHKGEVQHFGGVLVDPPRCGLDHVTRKLVGTYTDIVYISCNPEALARDLKHLCVTHELKRFAVFDQFAYTPHLECGVHLSMKQRLVTT